MRCPPFVASVVASGAAYLARWGALLALLGALPAGAVEVGDPCPSDLDRAGRCADNAVEFCNAESRVQRLDCGADALTCRFDGDRSLYRCLEADQGLPPEQPADGAACPKNLTFRGACYGSQIVWCNPKAVVESLDCPSVGATCGPSSVADVNDCVDPFGGAAAGEACPSGLDQVGHCLGEVLRWCTDAGAVALIDCSASGSTCGYVDNDRHYDCLTNGEPSGGNTTAVAPAPEACQTGAAPNWALAAAVLLLALRARRNRWNEKRTFDA